MNVATTWIPWIIVAEHVSSDFIPVMTYDLRSFDHSFTTGVASYYSQLFQSFLLLIEFHANQEHSGTTRIHHCLLRISWPTNKNDKDVLSFLSQWCYCVRHVFGTHAEYLSLKTVILETGPASELKPATIQSCLAELHRGSGVEAHHRT